MSDAPAYLGRVLTRQGAPKGTCFQITPGVVVTAWHVLRDVDAASVGNPLVVDPLAGGDPIEGRVVALDADLDLAVVRLDRGLTGTVVGLVTAQAVPPHIRVAVTGVPTLDSAESSRVAHTTGHWLGVAERADQVRRGQVEAKAVVPGMSGAPVRLAVDDRVVGVVSARYNPTTEWAQRTVWIARSDDIPGLLPADVVVAVEDMSTGHEARPDVAAFVGSGPGSWRLDFVRRLGGDWRDLATVLDIPACLQRTFPAGREAHEILDFLDDRHRLADLAPALHAIERPDLHAPVNDGTATGSVGPGSGTGGKTTAGSRMRRVRTTAAIVTAVAAAMALALAIGLNRSTAPQVASGPPRTGPALGSPTVATPPPGFAVLYSEMEVTLLSPPPGCGSAFVDLDTRRSATMDATLTGMDPGTDLIYNGCDMATLTLRDSAGLALGRGSSPSEPPDQCSQDATTKRLGPQPVADLVIGQVFCVITNQRAVVRMTIVNIGPPYDRSTDPTLYFTATAWKPK